MTFAKMFDTEYGDVLVMRQDDDEGNPEIRFYCEPEGLGLCSVAFSYSEDAYERRDEGFDKVTLEMAVKVAKDLNKFA